MTHFKTYSWLIILIISGHGILVIQGRLTKSMKKELYQQPEDGVPSASLPVTEKKETFPPQKTGQSQRYGNSEPESVNDFRPTAPGNSPGVGHSFTEKRFSTQSEEIGSAPAVPQSTEANGDDFRPTTPGHSPGGGHSKDNHVAKPNA